MLLVVFIIAIGTYNINSMENIKYKTKVSQMW